MSSGGDVAEWPGVHQGGTALQGLHQVGPEGVLHSTAIAPAAFKSSAVTGSPAWCSPPRCARSRALRSDSEVASAKVAIT